MPDKSLWLPLTLGVLAAGGSLVRSPWEARWGEQVGLGALLKLLKLHLEVAGQPPPPMKRITSKAL